MFVLQRSVDDCVLDVWCGVCWVVWCWWRDAILRIVHRYRSGKTLKKWNCKNVTFFVKEETEFGTSPSWDTHCDSTVNKA